MSSLKEQRNLSWTLTHQDTQSGILTRFLTRIQKKVRNSALDEVYNTYFRKKGKSGLGGQERDAPSPGHSQRAAKSLSTMKGEARARRFAKHVHVQ